MVKFNDLFMNFIAISLMILAILGLIFVLESDNNAVNPLSNHSLINDTFGKIQEDMNDLSGTSESQYNIFSDEKPSPSFGSIVKFSIVSIGKTFSNVIWGTFILVIKIPLIVLGIDQTIISMITSFLAITLIISAWLIYKFGG